MAEHNQDTSAEKINEIPKYSLWIVGILCFIFICIFIVVFGWKRYWDTANPIDHEVWGTMGDFIGGILDSILALLSVYLMYLTFKAQRILTDKSDKIQERIALQANQAQSTLAEKENAFQKKLSDLSIAQAETQRFNELFFELLHRYQELSQELTVAFNKDDEKMMFNYFDGAMEDLFNLFPAIEKYPYAVVKAERLYTEYYLAHAKYLAPIFRTLYRIMELIDSADILTKEKLRYAKIIRAQLRESELFFLRYNCLTSYGENFIEFINSYRLIKHLPIMSLLEFKYLKEKFGDDELTPLTLNMIFRNTWRTIYRVTVGKTMRSSEIGIEPSSSRYKLSLDMSSSQKTVIKLVINLHRQNKTPLLKSLSKLSDEDLQTMLKNFLMEVYRYSNFKKYNDTDESYLRFETKLNVTTDIKLITASVKSNIPLRLSHPKWDEEYGIY